MEYVHIISITWHVRTNSPSPHADIILSVALAMLANTGLYLHVHQFLLFTLYRQIDFCTLAEQYYHQQCEYMYLYW